MTLTWPVLTTLTLTLEIFRSNGDIVIIADCLFMVLTSIVVMGKHCSYRARNETLRSLLKTSSQDIFQPKNGIEMKILNETVNFAIRLKNLVFFSYSMSLITVVLCPIVAGTWEFPVPAYYPVNLENISNS